MSTQTKAKISNVAQETIHIAVIVVFAYAAYLRGFLGGIVQ